MALLRYIRNNTIMLFLQDKSMKYFVIPIHLIICTKYNRKVNGKQFISLFHVLLKLGQDFEKQYFTIWGKIWYYCKIFTVLHLIEDQLRAQTSEMKSYLGNLKLQWHRLKMLNTVQLFHLQKVRVCGMTHFNIRDF